MRRLFDLNRERIRDPEYPQESQVPNSSEALITPHVLAIVDLAIAAEAGTHVAELLRQRVADALSDFECWYNPRELRLELIRVLAAQAAEAAEGRPEYATTLCRAAAIADRG
jgi:hypothetical protein